MRLHDPDRAAAQFFEMVKGQAQLLAVMGLGQPLSDEEIRLQVASAVSLFLNGCAA